MSRRNSDSILMAFIAGAACGAVAALLLTPTPGSEVRRKIGEVTGEGLDKLKEASREAKFRMTRKTPKNAFEYEGGDCWV
jgi:gas vesicle protein